MSERFCKGASGDYKHCEHMKECNLYVCPEVIGNGSELYIIGMGNPWFMCKRDYPGFRSMTESEFIECYQQNPKFWEFPLEDFLAEAKEIGFVEG